MPTNQSSFLNEKSFQELKLISAPLNIFWFRRDLRLHDNVGLFHALQDQHPVLPLFIFDSEILDELKEKKDRRVQFIHQSLQEIAAFLEKQGSAMLVLHGRPVDLWEKIIASVPIKAVYCNHDYEPYARERDKAVEKILKASGIPLFTFKDQVIFEKDEILTDNTKPYTVYTPYSNRWRQRLSADHIRSYPSENRTDHFLKIAALPFPKLEDIGFLSGTYDFPARQAPQEIISNYHKTRDYPALNGTTRLGVHLRFGTVSIREMVRKGLESNETWLGELIWREFFMMILWHYPHVVDQPFKAKYARITWRNDPIEFDRWCQGKTGYPLVDAGMRELNSTGYLHNRVRMVTASFLTKHLLIDWRWGERYFAEKLLDYELASNNGNWQWSAGCGCDAAPYFRIFNPQMQIEKFDAQMDYVKRWVPEYGTKDYPRPIVEHRAARERALSVFKTALE